MRNSLLVAVAAAMAAGTLAAPCRAGALEVFQDLDELTSRIERLKEKPFEKTVAPDGLCQSELVIFKDKETGGEVWSLTLEECKETANIERRMPWSCNGSVISLMGNRVFRGPDGKISKSGWTGFNYIARADGSGIRKLLVTNADGAVTMIQEGFNTWDRKDPRAVYFPAVKDGNSFRSWRREDPVTCEMHLVRVRVAEDLSKCTVEPIYKFPNGRRKVVQEVSDDNKLIIQDVNGKDMQDMPNFYVIDLTKKPDEPGFARLHALSYGLQGFAKHDPNNEYRVHGISISRDGKRVSWGYGSATSTGEPVSFSVPSDNLEAKPEYWSEEADEWGQYMSHPGVGPDGGRLYFGGPVKKLGGEGPTNGWGLWVRLPGKPPAFAGKKKPSASGGHCSWAGNDPDWGFAHVYKRDDWELSDWILAVKSDVSEIKFICRPFDGRRAGAKPEYDGIPRPIQSPDATKCWFHSSMLQADNKFTGSYVAVFRRPRPPLELKAAPDAGGIRLTWKLPALSCEVRGVNIYASGPGAGDWAQLNDEPLPGSEGVVPAPKADGSYRLIAACEEWSRLESDTSSPAAAVSVRGGKLASGGAGSGQGLTGWDKKAPAAPAGLSVTREGPGEYRLKWNDSPDKDLRYYNVYFSSSGKPEATQKRLILSPPKGTTSIFDWTAPKEGAAFYAVTAVDKQGNESQPAHFEVK